MSLAETTLIARVRKALQDEPWEDTLSSGYTAASGTASFTQPTQWAEGDRAEFADGNILRVKATPSANPVSVKGGHNDTTDVNEASAAVALKNPEFEYGAIREAAQIVLDSLWPWAWTVATTNLTAAAGVQLYALPAAFRELISATQDTTPAAAPTHLQAIAYGSDPGYPVSIRRHLPTGVAASGMALWFQQVRITPTTTILVTYAKQVESTITTGNYVELDDGLMAKMVVAGVCAELLEADEIVRIQDDVDQGDIGVPANARLRDGAYWQAKFERFRHRYNLYLIRQHPFASNWAE